MIFSPTGGTTFSVAGTVTIDGQNYNCYVTRTKDEMYVSISYYRFNISIVYNGENEDGSSNSTYQVIDMKFIRTLPSYDYLYYYFILYLFMGPNYANNFTNTIGEISLICEYNEVGEEVNNYAVGKFGESSLMHDSEGNIVSINNAEYTYDEDNGIYIIEFEAENGYTYRFYFIVSTFSYLKTYGYRVYAFTRIETVTTGDYTVTVKRIIISDNDSFKPGAYLKITLQQNDENIDATDTYVLPNGKIYYIVREKDENDAIILTTYYKILFTEKSDGSIGEEQNVVPYASATITEEVMMTVCSADGNSYADISTKTGVVLISIDKTIYLIETTTYDEETAIYTVITTSGESFTVKIIGEEGNKTLEITQLADQEESEEL